MDDDAHKRALEDDIKNYKKLDKINQSEEFNTFFDLQINTVALKMLAMFTGKGPDNWDEFCKQRGEIIAYLYPIQQVRGAKAMQQQITDNLNTYYNTQP